MSVYNPDKATKAAWAALVEKQSKGLTPDGVAGGGDAKLAAHAADASEAAGVELREYVRVERVQLRERRGRRGRRHGFVGGLG